MLTKLEQIEKRFLEIEESLSSPEVVSDMEVYTKYMKEYKNLTPVVEKYREYKRAESDISDALAIIEEADDDDTRELAQAELKDANDPEAGVACAKAKYFAAEAANRCAYKAVQIHGGYGFMKDYPLDRMYRDAKITEIYEGTSEIHKVVISRAVMGK